MHGRELFALGSMANMTNNTMMGQMSAANPFANGPGAKAIATAEIVVGLYLGSAFLLFGHELEAVLVALQAYLLNMGGAMGDFLKRSERVDPAGIIAVARGTSLRSARAPAPPPPFLPHVRLVPASRTAPPALPVPLRRFALPRAPPNRQVR